MYFDPDEMEAPLSMPGVARRVKRPCADQPLYAWHIAERHRGAGGRLGFIWPLASARLAIGYRPTMGPAGSRYFVRLLR